jgi:RND family efflux transporter MFP subunit
MNRSASFVPQIILALLIVAAGAAGARALIKSAPEVPRSKPKQRLQAVTVREVASGDHPIHIVAHGVLRASREVTLRPEVTGVLTWVNEDLVPGNLVEKGAPLFRIDPRDYDLAVRRAQAARRQAEHNLELELGRSRIAKKEWDLFQRRGSAKTEDEARRLALREPQLATAQAAVDSAAAEVERTQLARSRTSIRAPFPAVVHTKLGEVGELVSPQTDLAHLVATAEAWIELPLTPAQLSRLPLDGSAGTTSAEVAGRSVSRPARVLKLIPSVDPDVRLARVLIEVEDPFGTRPEHDARLPVLLGSYCTVTLDGLPLEDVIALPRQALRERDRVYLLDDEDRLEIREVQVVWEEAETIWVGEGLTPGDRVVTSHVAAPVPGKKLAPQAERGDS